MSKDVISVVSLVQKSDQAIRTAKLNLVNPETLRATPLFHGMPETEIAEVLSRGSVRDVPRNTWLVNQGEPARELFLLIAGRIRLHQGSAQGEDMLVRFIPPGGTFGGVSFIPNNVQPYSALSLRPSRIVAWPGSVGRDLIQGYPRFALNLFAIAAQLLTSFQERCRQLSTQPVARRVMWALGELADTIGEKSEDGVLIEDPAMQRDLADLAGTTVYTVSRVLADLHRRGIMSKRRGHIIVRDSRALAELRDAIET